VDITEQILDDHHRQRRMFAELDDVDLEETEQLSALWDRLATFLEVHAEAEEELFYPRLLDVGEGASDADSASEETKDAIGDHNEIRDAVARSRQCEVGSDEWWQAVTDARRHNSDHMAEEERQALADFRQHTDVGTRDALGRSFATYEASHADGVAADDHDPDLYVEEHR
jgi:hypothetical protein